MFELDATLGRLKHSDYETLNIRATLAATSDDERSSSSTCFSTPRSKRANIRAGVPFASRIMTGRSGLCFLMTGYVDKMNCRVPAEAWFDWQQKIRISRRAGDSVFANADMVAIGQDQVTANIKANNVSATLS